MESRDTEARGSRVGALGDEIAHTNEFGEGVLLVQVGVAVANRPHANDTNALHDTVTAF